MTGPQDPYDIDPASEGGPAPLRDDPHGDDVPPKGAAPEPAPQPPSEKPRLFNIPLPGSSKSGPKGKLDAPALLKDFPEDADFDKDPELERVITGKTGKPVPAAPEKPAVDDFVKPGLGNAKVWAIVGTVLLVGALIATGVHAKDKHFFRVILVVYNTLLHTGTGILAILGAATLLQKRFGNFELAAARMYTAVSAFAIMFALKFTLFGHQWMDRMTTLIVASAVYVLMVSSTFNLWKKQPLLYVLGFHFFLWMIVQIGMMLSQMVAVTGVTPAK